MSRIVMGQYYPTGSIIHQLDPRVKLMGTIMYITFLLLVNHFVGYVFAAGFVALLIKVAKIPAMLLFRGLRPVIFILIIAALINLFFTPGVNVLVQLGPVRVTMEGVLLALQMGVRLTLLIVGSGILTLTTSPIELTDGIEFLLKPLKKIKVPAHDIAMMMTIALRFIPTLADEMDKIMKAQKARGADFETGGLMKRAKSLLPILVPLFVSAFKRADELATAMEARCYRGDISRTKMKTMKMVARDWAGLFAMAVFGGVVILSRVLL